MSEDDKPWAVLGFQEAAAVYESPSQNARVWSESWVPYSMFCPNCGRADIARYANNQPVADFACQSCHEDYELKSKKGRFGPRVVDGAYGTMMRRLAASDNPNLICMAYDLNRRSVTDLFVVPKQFFTAELIEERPPLAPTARRVGWGRVQHPARSCAGLGQGVRGARGPAPLQGRCAGAVGQHPVPAGARARRRAGG